MSIVADERSPVRVSSRRLEPAIRVCLLRGFELRTHGCVAHLAPSVQRLIALLALSDRALSRGHVAATLWLDGDDRRASARLRTALWRCKKAYPGLTHADDTHVALGDEVTVDTRELDSCIRRATGSQPVLGKDVDVLAEPGDLLPDWYDEWLLIRRESLRQDRIIALELLCERFTESGDLRSATRAGRAAVAAEPLRETAQYALAVAHLKQGNVGEALRQYVAYRKVLRKRLGIEPTERMRRLLLSAVDPAILSRALGHV